MILDLNQFSEFPAQVALDSDRQPDFTGVDDISGVRDMRLELNIQSSGDEYFCQGTLNFVSTLVCSRCLNEFDVPNNAAVDFVIRSADAIGEKEENVLDSEDYAMLDGNNRADVSDIARQAIVLSAPMKPVCSENCRGLCPKCGANRNEGACGCTLEKTDPRWDGLRDLASRNPE
jgi:uncharacterized protein